MAQVTLEPRDDPKAMRLSVGILLCTYRQRISSCAWSCRASLTSCAMQREIEGASKQIAWERLSIVLANTDGNVSVQVRFSHQRKNSRRSGFWPMSWVSAVSAAVLIWVLLHLSVAVFSDWSLILAFSALYILLWLLAPQPCPFEAALGAFTRA